MNKTEICIKLAEDYADRAAKGGANYEESYDHYLVRCLNREEKDLKSQFKIQNNNECARA